MERGARTSRSESVDIAHLGEPVARLIVGVDRLHPLTDRDREFLADLARDSAAALHGARVVTSLRATGELLQESRQQLVLAREEERRRLRADLHDQLGPTLAAAGLTAQAAGGLVSTQPEAAQRMLDQLGSMLAAAVGDVRRLVHDLRPPVLDELGLEAALRDRAEGILRGIDLRFEVPEPLGALPAAAEVAVFRIGLEALMNVAKHAGATTCTVTLLRTPRSWSCGSRTTAAASIRPSQAAASGCRRCGSGPSSSAVHSARRALRDGRRSSRRCRSGRPSRRKGTGRDRSGAHRRGGRPSALP